MKNSFNGRRVRSWCVDAGLTIDELAERIDVPSGTLKSWVYGQRSISFEHACMIADVFHKPVGELREQMNIA